MNFELNNVRADADYMNNDRLNKHSVVSEVFAAMVDGKPVDSVSRANKVQLDKAVNHIKDLGIRSLQGDLSAAAELNAMRRFYVETPVVEQMKLLNVFGSYQQVGLNETVEREVWTPVGEAARIQGEGGDPVSTSFVRSVYPVPSKTISGGYAIDYRAISVGDLNVESEGMTRVQTAIHNLAIRTVVISVYEAIKAATGVTFNFEGAGLKKAGVDAVLQAVRRFGKPTIAGDAALLSEFNSFAGYVGTIDTNTITGVSEAVMNSIANTGLAGMYNGAILAETPNPFDVFTMKELADGTKTFDTVLPIGLGLVIPTGSQSPIATWTRGGLTSFTGNDVATGKVMTRFDLEFAVDVAKGREYEIGILFDSDLGGLD